MKPKTDLDIGQSASQKMNRAGLCLLLAAVVVFVASFVAVFVIQEILPADGPWELIGLVVYFGGPLPIYPAVLAAGGIVLLAISPFLPEV